MPLHTTTTRLGCAALVPVLAATVGLGRPAPGGAAPARAGRVAAVQPAGPGGKWTLTFRDEFNGSTLNTAKWATGWFGSGITGPINSSEQECYAPGQVQVSGGTLNITVAKSPC